MRTTVRHAGSGTTVTVDSDGALTAAASAHGDGTSGGSSASATAFPVSVEELTKEWLSLVVGAPIQRMDVVSCDAGCAIVHKPMKYDPGNVVVAVGFRGTGHVALRKALAALKLVNKDPACDADRKAAAPDRCKVLADTKWAMDRNYEAVARTYPRAKFLLSTSSDPCPDELAHNARVRAALPGHALFDIDLASADAAKWRDFCAFVEAWSSCKTKELAKIAASWLRVHVPAKCQGAA